MSADAPPSQPTRAVLAAALQVPLVQRGHACSAAVHLHQVHQPLPGDQGHHPRCSACWLSAAQCRRGATAAGSGVPHPQLRSQHRCSGQSQCPSLWDHPPSWVRSAPDLLPCPQATVLEEMPPFPERESSILAKLKRKKGPGAASALDDSRRDTSSNDINGGVEPTPSTVVSPVMVHAQAGSTLPCPVSPIPCLILIAVNPLTLRGPLGAAGSPSPCYTPGSRRWEPPGGCLL